MKRNIYKFKAGKYNYRGYVITRMKPRHWVILDEDGRVFEFTYTLRHMTNCVDSWYREERAERPAPIESSGGRAGE